MTWHSNPSENLSKGLVHFLHCFCTRTSLKLLHSDINYSSTYSDSKDGISTLKVNGVTISRQTAIQIKSLIDKISMQVLYDAEFAFFCRTVWLLYE